MGPMACGTAEACHRVTGQEGKQLQSNADRPHAGPAAAVGDAEGFVQV